MFRFLEISVLIATAFFALSAYTLSSRQDEIMNRPRIGLLNYQNIEKLSAIIPRPAFMPKHCPTYLEFDIEIPIKNYGNLPAFFVSDIVGWLSTTSSFQLNTECGGNIPGMLGVETGWSPFVRPFQKDNYVMPGQEVPLRWKIGGAVYDSCDDFEKMQLELAYGLNGENLIYQTIVNPKIIDDPEPNKNNSNDIICNSHEKKNLIWQISNAN